MIDKAKLEFLGDGEEENKDFIDSDVDFDFEQEEVKTSSSGVSSGGGLFKKLTS